MSIPITGIDLVPEKPTFFEVVLKSLKAVLRTNGHTIPKEIQSIADIFAICIDDRMVEDGGTDVPGQEVGGLAHVRKDFLTKNTIGLPGAKLGLLFDLLAYAISVRPNMTKVEKTRILVKLEERLGVSFHTDDHQADGACHCQGCGYMAAQMKDPVAFNLEPEDAELIENFVEDLFEYGVKPIILIDPQDVLGSHHPARSVLIIRGKEFTLDPTNDTFIFHVDYWLEGIKVGVEHLIKEDVIPDSDSAYTDAVTIGLKRINSALGALAGGLPVIERDETGELNFLGTVIS